MQFEDFKTKVEEIRKICEKWEKEFCKEAWMDLKKEAYETLSNYDFAPLLGFICNRYGLKSADHAFEFPHWLLERIGSLEPNEILSADIKSLVREYFSDKFSSKCSEKDCEDYINGVSRDINKALISKFQKSNT